MPRLIADGMSYVIPEDDAVEIFAALSSRPAPPFSYAPSGSGDTVELRSWPESNWIITGD